MLVCLAVYFDGAGKEDDHPVITVAGFLADAAVCEEIECDWIDATGGQVFHLTDFGTNKCALGSRCWDEPKRGEFLKRLASIVNRPNVTIISASLEVAPFNEVLEQVENPQEIGPAFSGCAYAALALAEFMIMKQERAHLKTRYVFEKGDREHEMLNVFNDLSKNDSKFYGLRGIGFEPKQTILLQPADLITGVVQRCLISAHRSFPSLDNGLGYVRLNTFERYYSSDGVTSAVVSGHDLESCRIYNARTFLYLDQMSTEFFQSRPSELEKRRKKLKFKPKKKQ